MFDEKIVKKLYGIDADYWDMYEYLYEIFLDLTQIKQCLESERDIFKNQNRAKEIITQTNKRIKKIIKPWEDFRIAYKDDISFGWKKQF